MIRRFVITIFLAAIGGALLFAAAQAQRAKPKPASPPQTFTVDATASEINIILTQEGLMRRRYPTHRVLAKSFTGKIELPKDEAKMAVVVEADAKLLTNMDTAMSDFERKEFHTNLRGPILETDKFPTIKFTSVSLDNLQKSGDKRSFTINGDLTLHGVTRRVAFPVNATLSEKELRATGEAKLKQTDFGIKLFEKGMGLIKVGDELKISFSIIAKTQ